MAYYNSLQSLGTNTLQYKDVVEIAGIRYNVERKYLSYPRGQNDQVFIGLGILNKEKYCEEAYDYPPEGGAWPEYKYGDYDAATRVVKALFKIIEDKKDVKVLEKSEEEVTIKESKLSVLLPSKHRNIKQITIQKEITFSKL